MPDQTRNGYPVLATSEEAVPLAFITGRVAPFALGIFEAFCTRFATEVEPIDPAQSWGYARRQVGDTTTWSEHAAGTAIDLNATDHPQHQTTYPEAKRVALLMLLADFPRIEWGGTWPAASLDEMHFELRQEAAVSTKMISPVKGYKTSGYGWRSIGFHAGLDIATGGVAAPGYAAFDGVVEKIVRGRGHGNTSSVNSLAPGRTGDGMIIRNNDGERQLYGHVAVLAGWKTGTKISRGDLIGYINLSGNTTGYHLHLEVWNANRTTRNPELDFRAFGVVVGSTPKGIAERESKYPDVAMTRNAPMADLSYAFGVWLGAVGYHGTRWERVQKWLNHHGANLVVDGDPGPKTITAWQTYFAALTRAKKLRYGVTKITGKFGGRGSEFRTALAAFANDHRTEARKG